MKKVLFFIFIFTFPYYELKAQYSNLHTFTGGSDGSKPQGSLISDGTFLYGMTDYGGANHMGTVFKIQLNGTGYTKLLDFAGTSNGYMPSRSSLYYDGTYLYGITGMGGLHNKGVVFKILPNGSGYTKLHDFALAPDGNNPLGSLVSDGTYLYGTTYSGGASGAGTIFKIKPNGTSYSTVYNFSGGSAGSSSFGPLIYDGTYLYGMTNSGGINGKGNIFKIMPNGSGYTDIFDFDNINGGYPFGTVISDGTYFYGVGYTGGNHTTCPPYGCGVIFKVKTDGTGDTTLFDFGSTTQNSMPRCTLISDGTYLYGMTTSSSSPNDGSIFQIKPDGTGYTTLFNFPIDTLHGYDPENSLISDGSFLYGMTTLGGAKDSGVVFKFAYTTSINQNEKKGNVSISPNPTSDQFFIETNTTDKINVDLFDVNGRHVFSASVMDKSNISVATLDNGIYSLTIKTTDRVINKKLVIVH